MKSKKSFLVPLLFAVSLALSLAPAQSRADMAGSMSENSMLHKEKKAQAPVAHEHEALKSKKGKDGKTIWYCPMHPQIQQDHPGECPICSMTLRPMKEDGAKMDAMPESLKGLAPIRLSSWKEQLIGMKSEALRRRRLKKVIKTAGRLAGGQNDFSAAAAGFTAGNKRSGKTSRYVVADIYALDIPYLRKGQKAWVRGYGSHARQVPATVTRLYPYDGTQSRVMRVRLALDEPLPNEMFADVWIAAKTKRVLALPAQALIDIGSRRYVFVNEGEGRMKPVEVKLGFLGDDYFELLEGPAKGEKVVVGANFMVDADAQLKAVLSGMTGHQH